MVTPFAQCACFRPATVVVAVDADTDVDVDVDVDVDEELDALEPRALELPHPATAITAAIATVHQRMPRSLTTE